MEWVSYKNGELAKCKHDQYFIYKKFSDEAAADRWFAEYEPGGDQYGERGQFTGNIQGFETREEARRDCEENAKVMVKALSPRKLSPRQAASQEACDGRPFHKFKNL